MTAQLKIKLAMPLTLGDIQLDWTWNLDWGFLIFPFGT